ncbi:hypothetical protein ACIQXR_14925 [Peribacillus sp. NPDC097224]|uniref:hypothetical protein n=1 Tax=unclassified Peribacillus TaxID=2675266 RepID=UPI00381A4EB5
MNHLLTCTTEELALMVSVAGHHEIAKGIAETAIGDKSEKEWLAILEVTKNQLMMKNMWSEEQESREEVPLTQETQRFIEKYIGSKRMIRCSNSPQKSVLMLHHFEEDEWLFHLIDRDIIHEFAIIPSSEIQMIIREYYGISFDKYQGEEAFSLTEQAFDWLSNPKKVDKVRKKSKFTQQEEDSFYLFSDDLRTYDWTLFNISNFSITSFEEETYLENILFFLPSDRGIWLAEYTEDPKTPVHIHLANHDEWEATLTGIGDLAAYQGQSI